MQNNLTNESLVLVTFLHRPARKQIEPILQLTGQETFEGPGNR